MPSTAAVTIGHSREDQVFKTPADRPGFKSSLRHVLTDLRQVASDVLSLCFLKCKIEAKKFCHICEIYAGSLYTNGHYCY